MVRNLPGPRLEVKRQGKQDQAGTEDSAARKTAPGGKVAVQDNVDPVNLDKGNDQTACNTDYLIIDRDLSSSGPSEI